MELVPDIAEPEPKPPARWWFRVGATISIAILVIGVVASVLFEPFFRARVASIKLHALGAHIDYDDSNLASHVREAWRHLSNRRLAISASAIYFRENPHRHLSDKDLVYVQAFPHLNWLDLRDQPITSDGLQHLKSLQLNALMLPRTKVGSVSSGLAPLASLRRLQVLDLSQNQIVDADLKELSTLHQLRGVNLSQTQVSSAGIAHLNKLVEISTLNLDRTRVTDDVFIHLMKMRDLSELDLQGTSVTGVGLDQLIYTQLVNLRLSDSALNDAGLNSLSLLPYLSSLQIARTTVTPDGIATLKNLKHLRSLDMRGQAFDDWHLAALEGCTRLSSLKISDTQITPRGFGRLEQLTGLNKVEIDGRLLWKPGVIATLRRLPKLTSVDFKLSGRMQFDFAEIQDQLGPKIRLFEVSESSQ